MYQAEGLGNRGIVFTILHLHVPHLDVHNMDPTTPVMSPTVTHTTNPDTEPSQFILPDLVNDCHYPV